MQPQPFVSIHQNPDRLLTLVYCQKRETEKMALSLVDEFLKYGLFLGAIFQLVCIFAIFFVPLPPKELVDSCNVCKTSNTGKPTDIRGGKSGQKNSKSSSKKRRQLCKTYFTSEFHPTCNSSMEEHQNSQKDRREPEVEQISFI